MKYTAELVNDQGCVFDRSQFNSKKAAHEWASGRGGCKLILSQKNEKGERHTIAEFDKQ